MEDAVIAAVLRRLDQATALGIRMEVQRRQERRAALGLLEAVETLKQQFPPGSREAEVVRGALAGRDEAARVVLGE